MRCYNTTAICKQCERQFGTFLHEIIRGKGRFCCKRCSNIFYALKRCAEGSFGCKDQRGNLNPNWKGGISSDNYHYKLIQKQRYSKETKVREKTYKKIVSGKLVRQPCEVCGIIKDIQAHHDDYDMPDDVRWLCRTHHRQIGINK